MDDVQEIKNLVYAYAELLDLGDLDAMAALFERATVRIEGTDRVLAGPGAVKAMIEQGVRLYDGIPGTKHVTSNVIVEIGDGGTSAVARSYYTALQARPGFPLQPILAGRWHDRLEKVDGRWWFVDRVIHPDLVGDPSAHLRGTAG